LIIDMVYVGLGQVGEEREWGLRALAGSIPDSPRLSTYTNRECTVTTATAITRISLEDVCWTKPYATSETASRAIYTRMYALRGTCYVIGKDGVGRALPNAGPSVIRAWDHKSEYYWELGSDKSYVVAAVIDVDCHEPGRKPEDYEGEGHYLAECPEAGPERDVFSALALAKEVARRLEGCGHNPFIAVSSVDEYGPRGFHVFILFSRPQNTQALGARLEALFHDIKGDLEVYPPLKRGIRFHRGAIIYAPFGQRSSSGFEQLPPARFEARSPEPTDNTNYEHLGVGPQVNVDVERYVPKKQGVRHNLLGDLIRICKRHGYSDHQTVEMATKQWHQIAHPNTPLKAHIRDAEGWLKTYDPTKTSPGGFTWTRFFTENTFKMGDDHDLFNRCQEEADKRGFPGFALSSRQAATLWGLSQTGAHKKLRRLCEKGVLNLVSRGGRLRANIYRYNGKGA